MVKQAEISSEKFKIPGGLKAPAWKVIEMAEEISKTYIDSKPWAKTVKSCIFLTVFALLDEGGRRKLMNLNTDANLVSIIVAVADLIRKNSSPSAEGFIKNMNAK